jgi:hypothetical protein
MRIAITGHTSGIGRALYDYYSIKNEVLGFSRSNGYNLPDSLPVVIEESKGCDLFINNCYADGVQIDLFKGLVDHVGKMILMGSVARFYQDVILKKSAKDKQILFDTVSLYCLNPNAIPCLHLDISHLEQELRDYKDGTKIKSDMCISYTEVISAIDFWLSNPNIKNIEFAGRLTKTVKDDILRLNPNFTGQLT